MAVRAPCIGQQSSLCAGRLRGTARISGLDLSPRSTEGREAGRVENSGGIKASLQGRYASALFDLASEGGYVTSIESDLDNLEQALRESPDLVALIRNPEVSRDAAARAMNAVADVLGLGPVSKNFLGVLAANRRLAALPQVISAFHAIAAAARGEVTAEVASAHPLTDDQIETLRQKLAAREGRNIKLRTRVEPELLGGLVVTVGSKRIDSS